jgi:AcrR family transcriptional regulator
VIPPARDRIIEAALDLIARHGLAGVTMTSIAEAAGVTRQTLYNHFPTLDAIVTTALEQHAEAAIRELEGLLAATPDAVAGIEQLVRYGLAHAGHGQPLPILVSGLSAEARVTIDRCLQRYRAIISGLIEKGMAEGVFRSDLDPATASLVVSRMLEASSEAIARLGSPADAADLLVGMVTGSVGR